MRMARNVTKDRLIGYNSLSFTSKASLAVTVVIIPLRTQLNRIHIFSGYSKVLDIGAHLLAVVSSFHRRTLRTRCPRVPRHEGRRPLPRRPRWCSRTRRTARPRPRAHSFWSTSSTGRAVSAHRSSPPAVAARNSSAEALHLLEAAALSGGDSPTWPSSASM